MYIFGGLVSKTGKCMISCINDKKQIKAPSNESDDRCEDQKENFDIHDSYSILNISFVS